MKKQPWINRLPAGLAATMLMAAGASLNLGAAAPAPPALQGHLTLRPLTPQDIKDYKLTGLQGASGMSAVGVGQPAYLDAQVNIAIAASNIVSVTWELTGKPIGSAAALADSPLGANVPTGKMVEREMFQVAGRKLLRPDVTGQYVVTATIVTADYGTTNVTQSISASTYMGVQTCRLCHSGGEVGENMYSKWTNTLHASIFARGIDGVASDHYGKNCLSCHTVGYDANTNAANGGFDDVATQVGWTFPTVLTNGNWAALPNALKNVGNIQCENCHGPGSEHAYAFGNTDLPNWPRIGVTYDFGTCAQCHDSKNNHSKTAEWNNSRHAVAVEETGSSCARCHSAKGFANFAAGAPATATPYDVISCSACHDPHDATHPNQLRTVAPVKLMDTKTTVTEGGKGLMCMNCHISRRDATSYVEGTKAGSNRFGPHHGPQTDMLVGANAYTYKLDIPSSAHRNAVKESCVECHMQTVAATNAAFTKAGGHTFSMSADTTNGVVHLVEACKECHGEIESFDFKRLDYDGNGVVEGVQTEVKGLLTKVTKLLPCGTVTNHTPTALNITSNWTQQAHLRAAYNYLFVVEDGSWGVHNLSYAVGLLKASIADLTGDANQDGLSDTWQAQYFGSASNPNAAPNAAPAGDNIPNWLKYALGLNPLVSGVVLPDGVVWANAGPAGDPAATNTIQVYTAAEIVYNTEAGKTYQLETISSLGQGWKPVGPPITGTGAAISLVTPTRSNPHQFYRVVTLP